MKITKKVLDSFSKYTEFCSNDDYNMANGYPTVAERSFLLNVYRAKYGLYGNNKLTMKDIKIINYLRKAR